MQATCRAIVHSLLARYIQFPVGERLLEVVKGFYESLGFSQCAGAIDESHIPVSPPALNHTDYYNRKGWYSVILQGVIDHRFLFHEINIGWPGSVHKVLTNSALFKKAENGSILTEHQRMINDCNIPVFLIGNSAYPLKKWLLKPFADNDRITAQQRNFNYQFSRTRIVVEKAFGRTKGSMANAD